MRTNKYERNCAEAAFFLTFYGHYGSEEKAVAALQRRKDTKRFDKSALADGLEHALKVLRRMDELAAAYLAQHEVEYHPQLTEEQFLQGDKQIRDRLSSEFPDEGIAIDYFMSMNWHMPYVR